MKRRRLTFNTFEALIAEVSGLRNVGYQRAGQWSLTQISQHLRTFQDMSMQGFGDLRTPILVRAAGGIAIHFILTFRWIPSGAKAPAELQPVANQVDDPAEIERFLASVRAVDQFHGSFHPSPFFGRLSTSQWRKMHLVHAAHHLSFLIPALSNTKDSAPVHASALP